MGINNLLSLAVGLWSVGPARVCHGPVSADQTTNGHRGHHETSISGKSAHTNCIGLPVEGCVVISKCVDGAVKVVEL